MGKYNEIGLTKAEQKKVEKLYCKFLIEKRTNETLEQLKKVWDNIVNFIKVNRRSNTPKI